MLALGLQAQTAAKTDSLAFCKLYRPCVAHPVDGLVPFTPWGYQERLLRALDVGGPHIVLKARQIGISTTVMVQKLRRCWEQPGRTIVTVSINQDKAAELNRIALTAVNSCDPPFPLRLTKSNGQELEFENGSRIKTQPATEGTARGLAGSDIVLDEFAFWPLQEAIWKAARPAASRGSNVTVISTPDMEGDLFADLWQRAQTTDTSWGAWRFPWTECPDYGPDWYEANRPDYTQAEWASEFECSFIGYGEAVFSANAVAQGLSLWPQVKDRAVAKWAHGVDVAGEGRDETVRTDLDCSAFPYSPRHQEVWAQVPAPVLQADLEETHKRTQGQIAIDYTGVGYGVAQNLSCPHLRIVFTSGRDVTGDNRQANVPRHALLTNAAGMLERGELALDPDSPELLRALRTARWDMKKKGNFVDRLDSLLLALWAAKPRPTLAAPGNYYQTTGAR